VPAVCYGGRQAGKSAGDFDTRGFGSILYTNPSVQNPAWLRRPIDLGLADSKKRNTVGALRGRGLTHFTFAEEREWLV
jgi:hypothetical protein